MSNRLQQKLKFVDNMTINDVAGFFEETAEKLRFQAAEQAVSSDEKRSAAIDHMIRTPRIVMRYLKHECALQEAIKRTAKDCGLPVESVKNAWSRFCYDKSLYEMKRRNRLILELAALGFKNSEIGKKVNLHPNSVSRIITRARRDYHMGTRASSNEIKMIVSGGLISNDQLFPS